MLLRRVIQHVRQQEWTAIGIDFVIVVMGVFIGLQVSNWNTAKQQQERANTYSQRLLAELKIEYDYANSLYDYNIATLEAGNIAYLGLSGEKPLNDDVILINAFRASQYNWYERRRTAFDEIVASGALSLIPSAELRETAIGMYSTPIFEIMRLEGQSSDYRRLFRETLTPASHESLRQTCGDREEDLGAKNPNILTLSYTCKTELSQEVVKKEVDALRADPNLLRALKLRNAQNAGRAYDIESVLRTLGMDNLYSKK
jgi:hypothetical protein